MAKTKVLTITVQNQPGAVAAIAKALGCANLRHSMRELPGYTQEIQWRGKKGVRSLIALYSVNATRSYLRRIAVLLSQP